MTGSRSKLEVVDQKEDTRVPFLRGILTRSLQDAGMAFADAYALSTALRTRLSRRGTISTSELREEVAAYLEVKGFHEVRNHYTTPRSQRVSVLVRDRVGNLSPFSKAILTQSLEVTAASRDLLYAVAADVETRLRTRGVTQTDSMFIMRLTFDRLGEMVGERSARRYLRWQEFTDTDKPLILLVGGVTGTGKSTISSLLAHRLGIVRTQSTDMLREVMRRIIPKRLIPALHTSSFSAFQSLPRWGHGDESEKEPHMIDGYLMQAAEVGVGIEGVFRRAIRERVSLIIEGVHVHPRAGKQLSRTRDAIVIPLLLGTMRKKTLRKQLVGRGSVVESRRAERYLEHIDQIWALQTFLLSEADRHKVPIITESDPDEMVRRIMRVIAERLRKEFEGDPEVLFGSSTHAPVKSKTGADAPPVGETNQP